MNERFVPPSQPLDLTVNGTAQSVLADPDARLSDVLRHGLGLTGTKVGCNAGDCGAPDEFPPMRRFERMRIAVVRRRRGGVLGCGRAGHVGHLNQPFLRSASTYAPGLEPATGTINSSCCGLGG